MDARRDGTSRASAATTHLPTDGPHLNVSALFHGAPLAFSLSLLASGCTMRILRRWNPEAALDALARDVRSTCMVPTMFRQLLALPDAPRRTFRAPALAAVLHGREPCPRHVKQRMMDWLGPILVEYYGMTEGGLTVATPQDWLARPGTVGKPAFGMEVHILASSCATSSRATRRASCCATSSAASCSRATRATSRRPCGDAVPLAGGG